MAMKLNEEDITEHWRPEFLMNIDFVLIYI